MLFRVKITKCIDAIIESNSLDSVLEEVVNNMLKKCSSAEKTYVHILEIRDNELIDKGVIYLREVKAG